MDKEVKMTGIDKLIRALTLVKPFMNDYQQGYPTICEHDEMWLCVEAEGLPPEIVQELETLEFFVCDDGLKSCYFGSA